MSKRMLAASVALALALTASAANAQSFNSFKAGDLLARARIVHLDPANKDSIAITNVSVNDKVIPEVDFTYFLTPNVAAELILTYPQKHDVSSSTHGGKIGTLKHLPPVLSLQYHFTGFGAFKPYVGVGLNYTRFMSVKLPAGLGIDKNSFGLAGQVGFDYALDARLALNVDVKKAQIRTDLKAGASNLGEIRVDPLLVGIGVTYKF